MGKRRLNGDETLDNGLLDGLHDLLGIMALFLDELEGELQTPLVANVVLINLFVFFVVFVRFVDSVVCQVHAQVV